MRLETFFKGKITSETDSSASEGSSLRAEEPLGVRLGGMGLVLILILSFWRYTFLKIYPIDEGSTLVFAAGINEGRDLYRDLLCLIPPGTYYLQAVLFKIFGSSLWIGRAFVGVLNTAAALFLFSSLRRRFGTGSALSALTLFASLWASYNVIVNKNIFAFLLTLPLVFLLIDAKAAAWRARPYLLGLLVAGIALFKHNVALFMGAAGAAALVYEARLDRLNHQAERWGAVHALLKMAAGIVVLWAPVSLLMLWEGNFLAMIQGLFSVKGYSAYAATHTTQRPWFLPPAFVWSKAGLDAWYSYLLTFLPIVIGLTALVAWAFSRRSNPKAKKLFFAGALLSFALFATLYPRMERSHVNFIYAAFPVLLIYLGQGLSCLWENAFRRKIVRRLVVAGIALLGIIGTAESFMVLDGYTAEASIPRLENLRLRPQEARRLEDLNAALHQRIAPDESIQLFGDYYLIYFLLDRTPASPLIGVSYPRDPESSRLLLEILRAQDAPPDVILSHLPPQLYPETPLSHWILENYRDEGRLLIGSPEDPNHLYFKILRRNGLPTP